MENLNVTETETETETKTKQKRVSWKLEGSTLSLGKTNCDLAVRWEGFQRLNEVDQFVVVYGIKQACADLGSGIKDFTLRQDAIEGRFQAFIDNDEMFLPQGRASYTDEEKALIRAQNSEFLTSQGLPKATADLVAKSAGVKKLWLAVKP